MKTIPLTQGKIALVDDVDYEFLTQWKWLAIKVRYNYYAVRSVYISYSKRCHIRMHRIIVKAPDRMQVDHINCNGLDNRKSNLRLCTNAENQRHQRLNRKNTSGYKGVSYRKGNQQKPYDAKIRLNNKGIHVGCYYTGRAAGKAYDDAALKYFGQFALTNEMLGLL